MAKEVERLTATLEGVTVRRVSILDRTKELSDMTDICRKTIPWLHR
jgi:hypothetical protein